MLRNDCTRNCWIVAGLIGLAVLLFTAFSGLGVVAPLFLGFVTAWLVGGALTWAVCSDRLNGRHDQELAQREVGPLGFAASVKATPMAVKDGQQAAPAQILSRTQPLAAATGAVEARPGMGQAPTFRADETLVSKSAPPEIQAVVPVHPKMAAPPATALPAATVIEDQMADVAVAAPAGFAADQMAADKAARKAAKKAKTAQSEKDAKTAKKIKKAEKARKRADAEAMAGALLDVRAHGTRDELGRIEGIGPKLTQWLNANGIWRFEQIAAWTPAEVEDWAARLGRWGGRITSDDWVGQAKILAAGGETAHSRKFGAGETT